MWIVRLALRRPYTFIVASILILILGTFAIVRTPVDIFPNIDIPVVAVVWSYGGLSPEQMATRITFNFERFLTTTVTDIEHIESQSYNGRSVVKIFFHPGANIAGAFAQITAASQVIVRQLPQGTTPPLVLIYNASTVPIVQFALGGLPESDLNDIAGNFLRTQLVTIPGVAVPGAYGGKQRQIQVDLNGDELQSKGLSPADVTAAIANQNLILPSGTIKIGHFEYEVETNGSPQTVAELSNLPIKIVNGSTIYVRDVANVRDGYPPQTNIVRVDGTRAVMLSILKAGDTSTLDIISDLKKTLPTILDTLPKLPTVHFLSDQSIFVKASIQGVMREGAIAACLTGFMILVFLGSWRSTVIIAVSIPLSVLTSLVVLSALGETINIMTLGGLALAVGILVDDATVAIENINRNLDQGKELVQAILDGSMEIATPALVSTLSICIVFVPMFLLSGVARYLFVPLAEAVVFAMLASYLLSRTLVPTMAQYLLIARTGEEHGQGAQKSGIPLARMQAKFETGFERFRDGYHRMLETSMRHQRLFVICFLAACVLSFALLPFIGEDFFPTVDSGEFIIHMRAPTGTRIEDTAALCDSIENEIRKVIPPSELATVLDNIGLPYSGINTAYSTAAPVGPEDADIQVELLKEHKATNDYVRELRRELPQDFPGVTFYQLPVDMVTQILNFGLPAPIDVQIIGRDLQKNRELAEELINQLKFIPGTVDLRIQQPFNYPNLFVNVDRTKAGQIGLTQLNVVQNLLITLSGSSQTQPTYWLNPDSGITYSLATEAPQYALDGLQDLNDIPISGSSNTTRQILANVASITPGAEMALVSHYNIQSVIDIYGNVDGRDLGGVAADMSAILDAAKKGLAKGSQIAVRGQIETMKSSFIGLLSGLAFSILLVYLLIVVNFQSWLDPFIILMALPAALAGIVWMLFLTGTTISVPALTGAIMCMGVATANSILVISFSKDKFEEGKSPAQAALEAGYTRFRPVLMTALAMIIGMLPMALGLGEGGEENAPLGRAVIGGLLFATVATLFFVPVVFSFIHSWRQQDSEGTDSRTAS